MLSLDGTRVAVGVPTERRHAVELRDVATNARLGRNEGNQISPCGKGLILRSAYPATIELGVKGTDRVLWRLIKVENKEAVILLGDDEARFVGPQGPMAEPLLCCEIGSYCLPFAACRDRLVKTP